MIGREIKIKNIYKYVLKRNNLKSIREYISKVTKEQRHRLSENFRYQPRMYIGTEKDLRFLIPYLKDEVVSEPTNEEIKSAFDSVLEFS